jgi:hypothetical protein
MSEVSYNVVTFAVQTSPDLPVKRIAIALTGAWVRSAGVEADLNTAVVTGPELAKLGGDLSVAGTVEFWFSRRPPTGDETTPVGSADVSLAAISVLECKPRLVRAAGSTAGVSGVVEYLLTFADKRHRWKPPHSGLLRRGVVNRSTTETASGATGPVELTSSLVRTCLEALGETGAFIAAIDDTPPPVNLRWDRAWAFEELKRLLDRAHASVVIRASGAVDVVRLGSGVLPALPAERTLPVLPNLGITRRGKALLICSAPTATRLTLSIPRATRAALWEFVVPKVAADGSRDGEFAALEATDDEIRGLTASDPDPKKRVLLETAFRFVELQFTGPSTNLEDNAGRLAAGTAVLPLCYELDGSISLPLVIGDIAVPIGGGNIGMLGFANRVGASKLHVTKAGTYVLEFDSRIIQLKPGVTSCAAEAWQQNFERIIFFNQDQSREVKFRVTVEPTYMVDGKAEREFFVDGFLVSGSLGEGGPEIGERIAEAKCHELLRAGSDITVICRPELQREQVLPEGAVDDDDLADNVDLVRDQAEQVARAFVPGLRAEDDAATRIVAGFEPVELSGRVIRVEYDQASLTTTIEQDTYHTARPFLAAQTEVLKDSGRTVSAAESRGNTGAGEQSCVVLPSLSRVSDGGGGGGDGLFPVWVSQVGGSAGSQTEACSYTYDVHGGFPLTTANRLAEAVSVSARRPIKTPTEPGLVGAAYRDTQNKVVLLWVDEVQLQANCSSSPS